MVNPWFAFTGNGVAPIGHKEKHNRRMLKVLILPLHAMMRLIALADYMTKIVHIPRDVVDQVIKN